MDLDPIAIGFLALWLLIGIVTLLWMTHDVEPLRSWDFFWAIGYVCFWPLVLVYLFFDWIYVRTRERFRI